MGVRLPRSSFHVEFGGVFVAVRDVFVDGRREEDRFLAHHSDVAAEPVQVEVLYVVAVQVNLELQGKV